ncbi:MAG: Unknown protein [uncultured Sulfurovum sp.]|uniref:DUF4760 domain-containing protein n=1 Tax=uncultured Sulfurovum sp. TaxID=269237 RepID=A0A6S6TLJ7_9BACT|nr:MAG: Unknown protein [uncultured Sulfurovum sp.]
MSLDTWGNYADIVAVPIGLIGLILIIRQLRLALHESEREHQRRQNEMTLNAYNTVRVDLRETIRRVRHKLELNDMFDQFREENLQDIIDDNVLRDDVARMLGFLNKFAVGVKYDVFNIQLLNDLAGTLFIETFNQFKPYINWVRKDSAIFYMDYERLVEKLKQTQRAKDLEEASR